jgi:hypothetical protein
MAEDLQRLEEAYRVSPVDVAFGTMEYPRALRRLHTLSSCAQWLEARCKMPWVVKANWGVRMKEYADDLRSIRRVLLDLESIGLRELEGEAPTLTLANVEHVVIPKAEYDALLIRRKQ